jgi:predicted nucleotidyltransferase
MTVGAVGIEYYAPVLERLVELLRDHFGQRLVSVVLYGSVARGEARPQSDVDLLVVLEDPPANYHRRIDMLLEVQSRLIEDDDYQRMEADRGFKPFLAYLVLSAEEAKENRYLYLDMVEDSYVLHDRGKFFARKLDEMRERLREPGSRRIRLKDGTWYWDLKPDLEPGEVFSL